MWGRSELGRRGGWVLVMAAGLLCAVGTAGAAPGGSAAEQSAAEKPPRYQHRLHAERFSVEESCAACHQLAVDGRLLFPGGDAHRPCAGCHADFRARPPTTRAPAGKVRAPAVDDGRPAPIAGPVAGFCQTCHLHADPWRANPVRGAFSTPSEFLARFPHDGKSHQGIACGRCHPAEAGEAPFATRGWLAPTHRLCLDCHGELARPHMSECGGCHSLAGPAASAAGAVGDDWRVASFDHALHAVDVRTATRRAVGVMGWAGFDRASAAPIGCGTCHGEPAAVMARPGMARCDDCHDGQHAFSTTGFECARCHGGGDGG